MTADLSRRIADAFQPLSGDAYGVAVSGGGDSMALLHLMHAFASAQGVPLFAATVDHGLRPEAPVEAAMVAAACARIDVPHTTLRWTGWQGGGNLQNEARKARYRLLAQWGQAHNLAAIALGHTADDQAENFVMRLGRRAGVDGLAAMADRFDRNGVHWIRPLLGVPRTALRTYLEDRGIAWVDDPSNEDARFERVRIRKALAILHDLGVDAAALGAVANHQSSAKTALFHHMRCVAREIATLTAGSVALDALGFFAQPAETQRRLIAHSVAWINGADYAPRGTALDMALAALSNGPAATVQGCELRRKAGKIWLYRELQAVRDTVTPVTVPWDNRWHISPLSGVSDPLDDFRVAPLGPDGLRACPDWRDLGLPRGALLSSPSVWKGTQLVAAPLAGWPQNWQARAQRGTEAFFAAHITH